MKLKSIQEVGSRGVLFTFEFDDSVYLLNTKDKLFLCDTSEGHEPMEYIKQYIKEKGLVNKQLFVFNSHSDWDHIWGNSCFQNHNIISHKYCKERILEKAELDLMILEGYHDNSIKIKLPNITFKEKLTFEEDNIDFIYTPGHTVCSSICFDRIDKVVYVGDLIEEPIPVLSYLNLEDYVNSLEFIKFLNPKVIITSHSKIVSQSLIDLHIQYLKDVISGKYLTFTNEYNPIRHAYNMKSLLLLQLDEKMKYFADFNYMNYKIDLWKYISNKHYLENKKIWDISELSYLELKEDLEEYYEQKTNNRENKSFY